MPDLTQQARIPSGPQAQGLHPLGPKGPKRHGPKRLGPSCFMLAFTILLSTQRPTLAQEPITTASASGDAYVAEVLAAMERRANVTAKLRHQSRLGDETLIGSGNFWQLGAGPQRQTRWEMQSSLGDKPASYVQVFDGRYLWTDRNLPSGRQTHRLDVTNLKTRLRATSGDQTVPTGWESLLRDAEFRGGMSQMLAELLKRFHFDPPKAKQLNGFAVEALVGHWRPHQFAELCPVAGADQPWPEQLPHHVLVLVSQNNLFPHVIEYRRAGDDPTDLELARDPLVRYEIFEVRFADAIDATVFQFKPGDVDWSDETSLVFEKLNKQQDVAEAQLAARKAAEQK